MVNEKGIQPEAEKLLKNIEDVKEVVEKSAPKNNTRDRYTNTYIGFNKRNLCFHREKEEALHWISSFTP